MKDLIGRLLSRIREGDHDAYADVCGIYGPRLVKHFRNKRVLESDIEDLVQEVFTRLFQPLKEGQILPEFFEGRLWAVARNVRVDLVRRLSKGPLTNVEDLAIRVEASNENDALEDRDEKKRVAGLLDQLPQRYQIVLALYCDGLSYDEIASETGLTSGAVNMILHRARLRMRRPLKSVD